MLVEFATQQKQREVFSIGYACVFYKEVKREEGDREGNT